MVRRRQWNAGARSARANLPFCIALILLCLTLASMHLTSGLYARYASSAEGSDSARVAKFEVSSTAFLVDQSSTEQLLTKSVFVDIAPGETVGYKATVTNSSEVVVRCMPSIACTTNNIPLSASLEDPNDGNGVELSSGEEYTFDFVLAWTVGQGEPAPSSSLAFEVDALEITINVEQVD